MLSSAKIICHIFDLVTQFELCDPVYHTMRKPIAYVDKQYLIQSSTFPVIGLIDAGKIACLAPYVVIIFIVID